MSTYGMSAYLSCQLTSVLDQTIVDVTVFVRCDDNSQIESLVGPLFDDPRIKLIERGANIGPARSFMRLLALVEPEYDLVAFSDQDDVWLPEKLLGAAVALKSEGNVPALYLGGHTVVDQHLSPVRIGQVAKETGFPNALIENQVPGCCMVFNRAAHAALLRYAPKQLLMHDWWVYLVISAIGNVVNESSVPGMLYRQHGANVVGDRRRTVLGEIQRIIKKLKSSRTAELTKQLQEFEQNYADIIPSENLAMVRELLRLKRSICGRFTSLLRGRFSRHGAGGGFVWKVQFLLGHY